MGVCCFHCDWTGEVQYLQVVSALVLVRPSQVPFHFLARDCVGPLNSAPVLKLEFDGSQRRGQAD
jgi:hypothetical protein